jgi:hypothetical protein
MVNQLSQTLTADETAPNATPHSPTAGRTVDPGLLYIDGTWREASDGGTAPMITPIDESEITTVAQATESDLEYRGSTCSASNVPIGWHAPCARERYG